MDYILRGNDKDVTNVLKEQRIRINRKVCRNTRCAFFFFIDYKNRFIFFKLRYFEDFFGLCVRNI